jgi:hypothetical protein
VLLGFGLFAAALLVRSGSANRYVRGRLLVSAIAFGFDAVLSAAVASGYLTAATPPAGSFLRPLLLAFGAINGVVALAVTRGARTDSRIAFPRSSRIRSSSRCLPWPPR